MKVQLHAALSQISVSFHAAGNVEGSLHTQHAAQVAHTSVKVSFALALDLRPLDWPLVMHLVAPGKADICVGSVNR